MALKEFISADAIKKRVYELAQEIERDYAGEDITLVCVLKGSVVFTSDLARALTRDARMMFIAVSSYGDAAVTSGKVRIDMDLDAPVNGQNVLVVEDIVDTGTTLEHLIKRLCAQNPASVKVCALLDKPSRRKADVKIDYAGFVIPDRFVVGYGMDYAQKYRNLPYIGVLDGDVD